jgi:hypothetical protein
MATPFTLSGELLLPIDPGQPNSPIPFSVTDSFTARADLELNYTGSATETVNLGTPEVEGLKVLVIELDADPVAAPIKLRFNGGDAAGALEVSPGGFAVLGSPTPVAGVVSLTVTHTTDVKVRLRALS